LRISRISLPLLWLFACDPASGDSEGPDGDGGSAADDLDGDGYDSSRDCDDTDAAINPGAYEDCNGYDDDCDDVVDEFVSIEVWADADNDGYGAGAPFAACAVSAGQAARDGDCDDGEADIHPGAEDDCEDDVDSDCDARDLQCGIEGEWDLADAETALRGERTWAAGEYLGIGDIDGDGLDDLAMTTFYADGYEGGGAVAYGGTVGESDIDDVGDRIISSRDTTSLGRSISVGDVDGDGYADVLIGAPDNTCRAYVVSGPLGGDIEVADAAYTRVGLRNTEYGHGSSLGDLNGDGLADLVVGAYEDKAGAVNAGAVFIEYAPLEPGSMTSADTADATLLGTSNNAYAGRYIRTGANSDVNGDGMADIMVAAPYATGGAPASGTVYLVSGGVLGDRDLGDADAIYQGEISGEYAGEAQAFGDVNGDGLSDLVIGSFATVGGRAYAGAAYIVYGPADEGGSLGEADAVVYGTANAQQMGLGLAARDLDGDGADELLVGAPGDSRGGSRAGAAYLYWGPLTGTTFEANDATASMYATTSNAGAGSALGFAEFFEPGVPAIVVTAPLDNSNGATAGVVSVLSLFVD
jgi:FG-GAP repeat/Putative metal-binding motif